MEKLKFKKAIKATGAIVYWRLFNTKTRQLLKWRKARKTKEGFEE